MDVQTILDHQLITFFPKAIQLLLVAYFLFKFLDFGTGLLKTWKGVSPYKSRIMRDGLIRWIGEMMAIVFVIAIDIIFGLNFYLSGATLALFAYKEGGSVAENLNELGINMPGIVSETLETKLKVATKDKKEGDK